MTLIYAWTPAVVERNTTYWNALFQCGIQYFWYRIIASDYTEVIGPYQILLRIGTRLGSTQANWQYTIGEDRVLATFDDLREARQSFLLLVQDHDVWTMENIL